jgi:uncharacterized protein (TIGR00251 family)
MTTSANDEMLVPIRVIPRSSADRVDGERDGRLVVRTTAPPVDDRANGAVLKLIADHFGVRARSVTLVSGHRSRDKVVRIRRDVG